MYNISNQNIMRMMLLCVLLCGLVIGQPTEQEAQQNEYMMKRTACLVLSRYHSNTQKENIESVVSELPPEAQQRYINKMYAVAVETCIPLITMDQAQKFFVDDPEFNPAEMFYILEDFDYVGVANDLDTLSKSQEAIIKFIKNFDEEMQVRKEEREAEAEANVEEKFEMKFFGLSAGDVPGSAKILYLVVFIVIVGGLIYYGLSKLDDPKKGKSPNKRRKSPKKD